MKKIAKKILEQLCSKSESLLDAILPNVVKWVHVIGWPVLLLVGLSFVGIINNFYAEGIIIITLTGIVIFITNINGIKEREVLIKLRNQLTLISGSLHFLSLATNQNPNLNNLNVVLYTIGGCLFIISVVIVTQDWRHSSKEDYYRILTAIIVVSMLILSLEEIWIHFGSQFVWMPVSAFVIFFFFNGYHSSYKFMVSIHGISLPAIITLIILGLISTFYQFWFAEVMFGVRLWHILSGLGVILILLIVIKLISTHKFEKNERIENEKREKEQKERKEKEEIEKKAAAEKVKENNLERSKKILGTDHNLSWDDVFFLRNNFSDGETYILKRISQLSLIDLLEISKVKKTIVWNNSLEAALCLIEIIVKKLYDDILLKEYIEQVESLIKGTLEYKDYKGYEALIKRISESCSTVLVLIK